jgi:hypothetical protein
VNDLSESVIDQSKSGAKNFVTTDDFVYGTLKEGDIERSNDSKAHGDVPAGIARFKAVKIPEGLLGQTGRKTISRLA